MRRRLLVCLLLTFLVGAAPLATVYLVQQSRDEAMRAKFTMIKKGMTPADLESLFGRWADGTHGGWAPGGTYGWDGPGTLTIDVDLDRDHVVLDKHIHETYRGSRNVVDILRSWLRRIGL
jgi:hypothetical protein